MKPNVSNHQITSRRNDAAPRKSRNGLGTLESDRYWEGWNFPEGSPIHAQNIFESDHPWSIGNPSPPFVTDEFEKSFVQVDKGFINHLFCSDTMIHRFSPEYYDVKMSKIYI